MKTRLPSRALILRMLAVSGIVVLLAGLWKQRSELVRMKEENGRLQKEREQLQQSRTNAQAEQGRTDTFAAQSQSQPPKSALAQAPKPKAAPDQGPDDAALHLAALQPPALQPKTHPPGPEASRLALAGVESRAIVGGIETTMRFTASKAGPLGLVAMAIRLPRTSNARILDLKPAGTAAYADDSKTVSEDGRFAFFQGTLGAETNLQFALSVSEPATADVRGTHGIGAFQIEIQPAGASVRAR